jgi:hypothetical protein
MSSLVSALGSYAILTASQAYTMHEGEHTFIHANSNSSTHRNGRRNEAFNAANAEARCSSKALSKCNAKPFLKVKENSKVHYYSINRVHAAHVDNSTSRQLFEK